MNIIMTKSISKNYALPLIEEVRGVFSIKNEMRDTKREKAR